MHIGGNGPVKKKTLTTQERETCSLSITEETEVSGGEGGEAPGRARSGAALPPHPARRQHPWAPRPGAGGGGHASAGSFPIGPEFSVRQETGPCPERNDGKRGVRALTREKAE